MPSYAELVERLRPLSGITFRPASAEDLAALEALGMPESVVAFYRDHEPDGSGDLGLEPHPIAKLIEQNQDFRPGYQVSPFGYIVFATSDSGDAFCLDLKGSPDPADPRVVFVSHAARYETAEDVAERAPEVATSLADYLAKLAEGDMDAEDYEMGPPRD